jgi:membrane-bound lytic murein transglycosylase D
VLKRVVVRAGRGETVATIAKRYKVSNQNVAQWNKVGLNASFKPASSVVLFLVNVPRSNAPARVSAPAPARATAHASPRAQAHTQPHTQAHASTHPPVRPVAKPAAVNLNKR